MSEEILINVTPEETRVAIVENGVLQEVHIERSRTRGIVGNIYKGRVVRTLPGMQAAFIEIGLQRAAFLHVSDINVDTTDDQQTVDDAPVDEDSLLTVDSNESRERSSLAAEDEAVSQNRTGDFPDDDVEVLELVDNQDERKRSSSNGRPGPQEQRIDEVLREGQELIVQVIKDPIGNKGARLTTQITLPARYLVYMPGTARIGVSQKIADLPTRRHLRTLIMNAKESGDPGGYIVRTLAEAATEEEIRTDIRYLRRVWGVCNEQIKHSRGDFLIHEDLPLAIRAMRDLVRDSVEKIRIDSRETFNRAQEFVMNFIPEIQSCIEYYPGERPIFDLYSIEDEIQKALERKVPLKSGGYLVIDQTEAMTTIDVNTGTYVGRKSLEDTLYKTNLEAAQAIARQLRLRNIGGIIIIDFIDMLDAEHRRQVLRALEKSLSRDRTKVYMTEMSPLGLVELTRKRTRESLEHLLCQPCPVCSGRGMLQTGQTVCYQIFREILREARQYGADEYLVVASQVVIDLLLDEEAPSLMKLQEFIGKPIHLKVEPAFHQEQYDVVLI
jgi:ribonuclease G